MADLHSKPLHKTPETSVGAVAGLRLRVFLSGIRKENAAFWSLMLYMLIEYLRPQQMYPLLDVVPWGQLALIGCLVSILMTRSKPLGFGAMDAAFVWVTLFVILSVFLAWSTSASLKYWSTYTSWILLFFCMTSVLTTPRRLMLFVIFFLIINLKMSQHGARVFAMRGFSFSHWGLTGAPGWFHNSGEFALQMVVAFAIGACLLIGLKKYVGNKTRWRLLLFLFPGTAFISVIGSSSRGGQLALLCVLVALILNGPKLFRNLVLLTVVFGLTFALVPDEQLERFSAIGGDQTSELRLIHWRHARDVIEKNPFGIGYKNWEVYYPRNYDIPKVEQIHNTSLEAFVDLGIIGGTVFHIAVIMAFVMNRRTYKEMKRLGGVNADSMAAVARGINLSLLGTFVAAFFMSVLYYPMFWVAFALTSSLRHIAKHIVRQTGQAQNPQVPRGAMMKRRTVPS